MSNLSHFMEFIVKLPSTTFGKILMGFAMGYYIVDFWKEMHRREE